MKQKFVTIEEAIAHYRERGFTTEVPNYGAVSVTQLRRPAADVYIWPSYEGGYWADEDIKS